MPVDVTIICYIIDYQRINQKLITTLLNVNKVKFFVLRREMLFGNLAGTGINNRKLINPIKIRR